MKIYENNDWKEVILNNEKITIPNDWDISKIEKKINEFKPSKMNASEGIKSGIYPFFNASQNQTLFSNNYLVDDEAVIITTGGDYAFSQYFNGKFAYSSHVWSFKMKEDNSQFFTYLFKYFFDTIQNLSVKGFKLKNLNKKDFKNIDFYFPPIQEQNNIVSLLSSQERIIEKIKILVEKLEKRNKFMINELLSGRLRVKEENEQPVFYKNTDDNWQTVKINGEDVDIPKDWDSFKLKGNIDIKTGKKDANVAKKDGQYAFFTCGKKVLKTDTYDFDCEAILIAGNGDVGETKYYHGKFDAYQRTYVLSNYKYDLKFLYIYMNKLFKDSISALGSAMPYIKLGYLEDFSINQPNSLSERELLLKIITSLIQEKEKYEQILYKEEQTFTFLLEELMSGKLRVEV